MTHYDPRDSYLAHARFASILNKQGYHCGTDEFYDWLFPPTVVHSQFPLNLYPPMEIYAGSSADEKMKMLLSEHWYTLIKAYLINHPWVSNAASQT